MTSVKNQPLTTHWYSVNRGLIYRFPKKCILKTYALLKKYYLKSGKIKKYSYKERNDQSTFHALATFYLVILDPLTQ